MRPSPVAITQEIIDGFHRHGIRVFPSIAPGDRMIYDGCAFEPQAQFPETRILPLGSQSYSQSAFGPCKRVGRFCSIGKNVAIFGDRHPIDRVSTSPTFYRDRRIKQATGALPKRPLTPFDSRPKDVIIGNDVWIADDVRLRDGIHIGDGAIVASGSVVTRGVPPYAIVAGNPARVIRRRFDDRTCDALQESAWWMYPVDVLQMHPMEDPAAFVESLPDLARQTPLPEHRLTLADLIAGK